MQHKSNYSINKLQILQIFIYFKHLVMTYIKLMTHNTLRDTPRHHTILKKIAAQINVNNTLHNNANHTTNHKTYIKLQNK